MLFQLFATEKVTDDWCGQAFVSDEAVRGDVTDVNQDATHIFPIQEFSVRLDFAEDSLLPRMGRCFPL